jgi:hypothetical protein
LPDFSTETGVAVFIDSRLNFGVGTIAGRRGSIIKYELKIMYEVLFGVIAILWIFLYFSRERFGVYGQEIVNVSLLGENTCKPGHELDAGLCYEKCRAGYHGVGPVCWADTVNIGIGTVVGLEDCPDGWFTEGLTCRQPLTGGCTTRCDGNWDWSAGGFCKTRCEPIRGGRLKGRLDGGGKCPGPQGGDKPDLAEGMCYGRCPTNLPKHVPAMPYLCYVGGDLSYGRGVGKIPKLIRVAGKYPLLGPD